MKDQLTSFIAYLSDKGLLQKDTVSDELIADFIQQYRATELSSDDIVLEVAKHFNMTIGDMKRKTRRNNVKEPRHIAYWMLREYMRLSFKEIGIYFGGYSHSAVFHGISQVNTLRKWNKQFPETFDKIHHCVLLLVEEKIRLKQAA